MKVRGVVHSKLEEFAEQPERLVREPLQILASRKLWTGHFSES